WANVGLPERAFASEVGFLASWWVGLFAGWFLARVGLVELSESGARYAVAKSFIIVACVAQIVGAVGALLGVNVTRNGQASVWRTPATILGVHDLRAFEIVAYLHLASYAGAVLGLACAMIYVRRRVLGVRQSMVSPAPDARLPIAASSSPQR